MDGFVDIFKKFNDFLKNYWLKNPAVGFRRILSFYLLLSLILFLGIVLKEYLLIFLCLIFLFGMTIYFFRQWKNFGYYHRLEEFKDLGVKAEIRDFVLPRDSSKNKRELYLKNEDIFYSKIFLNQAKTKPASYNYCRLILDLFFSKGPKRNLVLGGGGGAVSSMIANCYSKAQVEVIEVSNLMIEVAKKYFFSPARVKFINQDAYDFVNHTKSKYDFIFVNIFVGEKLPDFFGTKEFIGSLNSILDRNGVLVINTGKNVQKSLGNILKRYRKIFKPIHLLVIDKTVIFLICRKHYTREQIFKLSQKAKLRREIEKMMNENWLKI